MKCPHCHKEIEIKFANPAHAPYECYDGIVDMEKKTGTRLQDLIFGSTCDQTIQNMTDSEEKS
jgi:hypothetical protein